MQSPYPIWQQLLILGIMPPVVALIFGALARGWARTVQGGRVSEETSARQRKEVLAMMGAAYIVGFGTFLYVHFVQHR